MQAESIISQFIEFYARAINQMSDTPAVDDLPPMDPKAIEELLISLDVMKTIFIANLTVKSTLKEMGYDTDEFDK